MTRGLARAALLALVPALGAFLGAAYVALREDQVIDERVGWTIGFLVAGAFLAALATIGVVDRFLARRSWIARALAVLVVGAASTLLLLAGAFGFHFYLTAYGEHEPLTPLVGWLQLLFTTAQGMFFFGVFGMRFLWPGWVIGLVLFALLAGRRPG